jgi:hypothetical protein
MSGKATALARATTLGSKKTAVAAECTRVRDVMIRPLKRAYVPLQVDRVAVARLGMTHAYESSDNVTVIKACANVCVSPGISWTAVRYNGQIIFVK